MRELFGLGLGTGDYGHLTVEHASMLLRNFRSLRHYSNQGFEAAHKLQKQIFSRATNHDGSGEATCVRNSNNKSIAPSQPTNEKENANKDGAPQIVVLVF